MFEQVVCATPAEVRAQFRRVKPRKLSGLDAGRAEHRAGERDRPGRRWQRPVANRFSIQRSAGRRPPRAGRTRSPSAIIGRAVLPRRPKLGLRSTAALPSTARRAGWVGCNLALTRLQGVTARQARVPAEARTPVVTESQIAPRPPFNLAVSFDNF
jgi:hypothetical protein